MERITPKQRQALEFIRDFMKEHQYPPSVREICRGMGLSSPATAHAHLKALERAGYLRRDGRNPRALLLKTQEPTSVNSVNVPVVGQVAAGLPILAIENIEGYIPFDPGGAERDYFALRVKGTSMIGAGILEGDLLVVAQQDTAENGEIVVALLDGEATVKRLKRTPEGQVWLLPENPEFQPIDGTEASILGKVVASMRTY